MNDRQLIFENIIPLEVYTDTGPASLVITLNDKKVFNKVYAESTTHKETVRFEAEHDDGAFNKLSFAFSGPPLTANKHLRVESIKVNKQPVNVLNSEYFPEIDESWWSGLSSEKQQKFNDIIYGKAGNTFGWWGEINFYYCSGFDYKSKMRYNRYDNRTLLHEQINWVYLDEASIKTT